MQVKILWADDEIDLLKPHIIFLEQKGYHVETVNNGAEAIDKCQETNFDIVFLDENMPGISGLEALTRIKNFRPLTPIVMITKSEEESIMEEAIGGKIADYLIKPVNPNQILLSLKKNLDQSKLVSEKTNATYQQEFRQIGMDLSSRMDHNEWSEIYKKLVHWDIQLQSLEDKGMKEVLEMQKKEANASFCKFIESNYLDWLHDSSDAPLLIHRLFQQRIAPKLEEKTFLIVIDNLRFDQWQVLRPAFNKYFQLDKEEIVFSILPTSTQYARNSFFAGLLPSEIEKKFPQFWTSEDNEGGKNNFEEELLQTQLKRLGKNDLKWSYNKITNLTAGKKLNDQFSQLLTNDLNVIVYNFVDMLSHARTDMKVIKELADDEAAYRSLTESWFEHSPLQEVIKKIYQAGHKLMITTDHGTIRVTDPVKVVGTKNLNTNLRYKTGKNLNYNEKKVFKIADPKEGYLPQTSLSSEYIFCKNNDFFVYPNNFNHFVNHYKETFQHGGVSLEEMLIPYIELSPKK